MQTENVQVIGHSACAIGKCVQFPLKSVYQIEIEIKLRIHRKAAEINTLYLLIGTFDAHRPIAKCYKRITSFLHTKVKHRHYDTHPRI